jgi:hypothetical protein
MSEKRKLDESNDLSLITSRKKLKKTSKDELIELLEQNNKILLAQIESAQQQLELNKRTIGELKKNSSELTTFLPDNSNDSPLKKTFFFEYKLNYKKIFSDSFCKMI